MYDATALFEYLDSRGIPFKVMHHRETATAIETAKAEHVSLKRFAKTVVVKAGDALALAILPAHLKLDLDKLRRVWKINDLRLASEAEFKSRFPDCEVGAMPPFGHLYALDVFIDDDIAVAPEVTFNACIHEYTITVSGKDFLKAAEGVVADISAERTAADPTLAGVQLCNPRWWLSSARTWLRSV
jgi:Ala-tRNA(Pro) deacylase